MPFEPAQLAPRGAVWATILALVGAEGTASHRMSIVLAKPLIPARDVADVVHALGTLHGRLPGVIDHALAHNMTPAAQAWLEEAAEAFATERTFLAHLASAGGPLPSTPGHAEAENTVAAQRHAMDMLAQSDRHGCAIGAAAAVLLDWTAIRSILDLAAHRFGLTPPRCILPSRDATGDVITKVAATPGADRAIGFAVQQMLAQHRGLWDLLDARASARNAN